MRNSLLFLPMALLISACSIATARHETASATVTSSTLLRYDFNAPSAWPDAAAAVTPQSLHATVTPQPTGTVDVANTTQPSGALLLNAQDVPPSGNWSAAIVSGLLPVRNSETNLAKLTLSFDCSVSSTRPVLAQIESFNAKKQRTGGLQTWIYPAAPDFYQRSALDLSAMQAVGSGTFRPTDPFVQLTFKISGTTAAGTPDAKLRVDNVAYARPAFYVSPQGSDKNDGRTEKTAFATPQKAIDAAAPGDIVLVMAGMYLPQDAQTGVVGFRRAGTPAAWITLKNYPGQKPVFSAVGAWNAVRIGQRGTKETPSPEPALAYIEVRGLQFRGDDDVARQKYPDLIGKPDPHTNGNALSVLGRFETNVPHHIRVADCLAENCAGGGIIAIEADWITAENNLVRDNCWTTMYAGSGISYLTTANFDGLDNVYKDLIRNNAVSGNRCFEPWAAVKKVSDGNGIIVDSNYDPAKNKNHRGRTLIQNNLSFNNGGSGIHAFKSHRVDIVNNTAYYNGASPELKWGQIFVQLTDDIRIMNNILVSRPGQPVNSVGPNSGDQRSTNIVRANNLYFGGLTPTLMGERDLTADPQFVNASIDAKTADFHLRPGSPALKSGVAGILVPLRDLEGRPRPTASEPDRGVYQR